MAWVSVGIVGANNLVHVIVQSLIPVLNLVFGLHKIEGVKSTCVKRNRKFQPVESEKKGRHC